jgi:hypothetical protein
MCLFTLIGKLGKAHFHLAQGRGDLVGAELRMKARLAATVCHASFTRSMRKGDAVSHGELHAISSVRPPATWPSPSPRAWVRLTRKPAVRSGPSTGPVRFRFRRSACSSAFLRSPQRPGAYSSSSAPASLHHHHRVAQQRSFSTGFLFLLAQWSSTGCWPGATLLVLGQGC